MTDRPVSVRLPKELNERLTQLAEDTGRTKSYYIIEALNNELDYLEFIYGLQKQVEDYRAGRLHTYSAEEMIERYGLDI